MPDKQNTIEDLMTLGGTVLSGLLGARHELKAQARQRGEHLAGMLGLVGREEFDAAFAMLAKARTMQEELADRIAALEKHLKIVPPKNGRSGLKANLPSVKKDKRRKR